MKAPLPDLFDKDKTFAPAVQPLRSKKRETFCLEASRDCWGNNTEAYCRAFGVKDRDAAGASAARLMRDPAIKARIAALRNESIEQLGIDRKWILERRKYIAEHGGKNSDRLTALGDIEKSLGLDAPMRIDLTTNGNLNVLGLTGVIQIDNPAEFARAMEAVRAQRDAGLVRDPGAAGAVPKP